MHRHVLTGSYNNFFHIYDREGTTDITLQADKSAFKAKKIGAAKGSKGSGFGKPATKVVNGKSVIDVDAIDFNKKILHGASQLWSFRMRAKRWCTASYHPKDNVIAIAATNNVRPLLAVNEPA